MYRSTVSTLLNVLIRSEHMFTQHCHFSKTKASGMQNVGPLVCLLVLPPLFLLCLSLSPSRPPRSLCAASLLILIVAGEVFSAIFDLAAAGRGRRNGFFAGASGTAMGRLRGFKSSGAFLVPVTIYSSLAHTEAAQWEGGVFEDSSLKART